ncbi:hypothetical protein B0H34DRAFT_729033 [Crassisporium funariophilum]|nr:hypothetical protein B0H34DRAFT_729033 [Crassisporium funariophilum]
MAFGVNLVPLIHPGAQNISRRGSFQNLDERTSLQTEDIAIGTTILDLSLSLSQASQYLDFIFDNNPFNQSNMFQHDVPSSSAESVTYQTTQVPRCIEMHAGDHLSNNSEQSLNDLDQDLDLLDFLNGPDFYSFPASSNDQPDVDDFNMDLPSASCLREVLLRDFPEGPETDYRKFLPTNANNLSAHLDPQLLELLDSLQASTQEDENKSLKSSPMQ